MRKDKNDITAEELIGKLGKDADEKLFADKLMPIDLPDGETEASDGDLDISELMRKYMPEYEEGSDGSDGEQADAPSFDDGTFEQLNMGYDEAADDGTEKEEEEHSAISFADSIFSEYDITSDKAAEPDEEADGELNGSREVPADNGNGHEIESERTRRFLSSLLHRDRGVEKESAESDDADAEYDDEKSETVAEPEYDGPAIDDDWTEDEEDDVKPKTDANAELSGGDSDEEFIKAFTMGDKFVDREDLIDDDWTEDEEEERPAGTFGAKPKELFLDEDEDGEDEPEQSEAYDDTIGDEFDPFTLVTNEKEKTEEPAEPEEIEEPEEAEETATPADEEADENDADLFADLFSEKVSEPEENGEEPDDTDTYGDEFDDAEDGRDEKHAKSDNHDERDDEYDDGEDEYDDEYADEDEKDGGEDEYGTVAADEDYSDDDKKDVDPTDINLMIAFDIDSDDEETKNRAKELGDKLETKHAPRPRKKYSLDRAEYVDKSQTSEIRAEFKKKRSSLTVRALLCAVCAAVLFVFENIPTLTQLFTGHAQQFTGAVDPALYPVVYIMVSLQITLLACLCAIPEIIDGVKYLLKGAPRPSTMTALLAVASIIYAAVLSSLIKSPNEPVMYGFVVAMSALMTIIGEKFNNKREMMNFRVIAGKKPKNVVRRLDDEESEYESNAFPSSDRGCDVMKIEKTDFISNFFARLRSPDQTTGTVMTFMMSVTVAVGVLFGIISNFRAGVDAAGAWRIIFATMFMLAPVSIQIAFSYPFYRANRAAAEYDSAIIGDVSLEEYSNASIISFDDKNVFPSYSVKVQNIRIYNNARIDRVLYYASSVFAYAGGPLQDVFEIATKDMGTSDNVRIFDTEPGFLATQVDGVNIIFGSYDALSSRGLEIPQNAADDDVDFSDDLSIMYMFRESVLVAKMYIKYDMDEDIDVILKQFAGDGLYVCVRTFDPNIDEKMVARKLGVKHVPLKVVRYVSTDEVGKYEEKIDSGLVTSSSPKSLLQVISYCEKVKLARKTNTACGVISLVIGVLLMMFIVLSNSISALSSFLIAVYQIVWIITMVIASKIHIR